MHRISSLLTVILLVGAMGTLADLLLLGHVEGWQQLVPVVLLAAGVVVGAWHLARWGSVSLRAVQLLGGLYVVSGLLGVWFHYAGNLEFEREMAPDAAGWPLIKAVMTGATPALAPGTMIWFGALALTIGWIGVRMRDAATDTLEE
jgi:hypothetical protein